MAKLVPFIGRKEELEQINALIKEWDTQRVVCIEAPGGIGKTRLLQEVYEQYSESNDSLLVADIIDFDDRALHISENIERAIVDRIGKEVFDSYLQGLQEYRRMEVAGVISERLAQQRRSVYQIFIDNFNEFSSKRRVVLFLDTLDALPEKSIRGYIATDLVAQVKNTLTLIAGRNVRDIREMLQSELSNNIQLIILQSLKEKDRKSYLQQKQDLLHTNLEPEIAQKLSFLAMGRPILIDLAVECWARGDQFEWLVTSNLEEIKSSSDKEMKKRHQEFERQLMLYITQTRTRMDWLTLAISHVYPLNVELITDLLDLSRDEAEQLFTEAQTYSYVKSLPDGTISLHDEVRRMVDDYVWNIVDRDGSRRRRDSRIAAEYFEGEIEKFEERIEELEKESQIDIGIFFKREELVKRRDTLLVQRLEHTLFFDIGKGFSLFEKAITEARRAYRTKFADTLCKIVQSFTPQLNPDQEYRFDMIRGRVLEDKGSTQEARKKFQQLLDENQNVPDREADIYNALGVNEIHLGDLERALEYQKKSLGIIEQLNKKQFVPILANMIGYIHRMRGEWAISIEWYRKALDTAVLIDVDLDTIANIQNNLGYVLALEGRCEEAVQYCEQAIRIWEKLKLYKKVGQGETTLGAIYRYRSNYDLALKHHKQSLTRFEEPEDSERMVRAYFQLGFTQWFKGDEEKEKKIGWHKLARESFEKSLELAEKYFHIKELPSILHESSHIYRSLDQKDKAWEVNNRAHEIGKKVHDIHYAINSLVAKAEFDFEDGKYDNIPSYAEILKKEYKDKGYNYPLFYGRMRRIQAEVAFVKKEYETSFSYYAEGLSLIMQHGGYGRWLVNKELDALEQKFLELPPEIVHKWSIDFKKYWSEQKPIEKYAIMVSWCDQQIVETKLRLKG